ncbi:MAG: lamin tail domain-containing protein [Mariniblastus sp.]
MNRLNSNLPAAIAVVFSYLSASVLLCSVGCSDGNAGNGIFQAKQSSAKTVVANSKPTASRVDSVKTNSSDDIFSRIWELPESHISTTKLDTLGKPLDPNAIVVVHEQGKAGRCLDEDNAPMPLLSMKDESVFEEPTFKTFIALLDNYTAAELRPEVQFDDVGNEHWREVDSFLDEVFKSKTMKVAVEHIRTVLAPGATIEDIHSVVRRMWFEPYTNRYGKDQPFCVGFEHVFVGEDESNESGAPKCEDRVGGYHSWVKFYLEQKAGKTDYLGYDYPEGNVADALDDHKVTTIVMRWSPTSEDDGSYGHDLMKKPGGFFVGTRPELEIAFGTLAFYSQKAGKYDNVKGKENHHRVRLGENFFDIVMHPQTVSPPQRGKPGKRGDHIRTLYPKFRGRTIPGKSSVPTANAKIDLPTQPHNDSPIQIARVLVNPSAADDEGEWVELKNSTDETTFDLSNWHLSDRSGRTKKLSGSLEPGKTVRVMLERESDQSMMLKNGDGWVVLFQKEVRRAAVRYSKPGSDEVVEFLK